MNTTSRAETTLASRALLILTVLLLCAVFAQAQTTWTERNPAAPDGRLLWGIAEGASGMVACGNDGRLLFSADGKTWTRCNSGTSVWLVAVTYGNNRYIVVGDNGTILSSIDGTSWKTISVSGTTARLNNVLYANGKFVAVGERGTIVVSETGDSWSATTSGVTGWLHGLAYGAGTWVATGEAGTLTASRDGSTWQRYSSGVTENLEAVTFAETVTSRYSDTNSYTNSYFVAVGAKGKAIIGYSWESVSPGSVSRGFYAYPQYNAPKTTVRLSSIASYDKVFVTVGDNGTVLTAQSYLGPWTPVNTGTTKLLNATGFGKGSLFIAGENETILQSEAIFPSRLGNVSTRALASSGANSMIAGTVIAGTKPKQFLVRGVGPGLSKFNVPGVLPDPVLEIYDVDGRVIATNSGWEKNPSPSSISAAAQSVGAFALDAGSKDTSLVISLNPGAYTFMLKSASGTQSGIGLVEAYDMDPLSSTSTKAINISTRAHVGTTAAETLITGLVVQGPSARTVLLRAVGPTLGSLFGLSGSLEDPVITLFAQDGSVIATNDNWSTATSVHGRDVTSEDIRSAAAASGAFPLPADSKDASLLVNLTPGNYTVHVTSKNAKAGIALAEAYEVPTQ
jgi:hypothetical protein